jgi:hypothetical protein
MVGFWSGDPVSSPGVEAQGTDEVPATTGQVISATLGSAVAGGISARVSRDYEAPTLPQMRDPRIPSTVEGESTAASGQGTAPTMLSADDANSRYSVKGPNQETSLAFTNPVPEDVAQSMYQHRVAENMRQDTINRAQSGILTSAPARLVYGLVGGLTDPVNLAAGFIPGVGEANEARIAASAGGSMFGQIAARAASGVVAGAGQAAALEPFNAMLDAREGQQWTLGQAMRDIAFGGVMGGGLHVVGGVVHDALGRETPVEPVPAAIDGLSAEGRSTLLQGALGQALDDRPPNMEPIFNLLQAREATDELRVWAGQQDRINNEADTALQQSMVPDAPDISGQISDLQGRLGDLRDQAASLRGDLSGAAEQTVRSAMDPVTTDRLASVEQELAGVIPARRRADLEQQRNMLLEGRGQIDARVAGQTDLDVARGQQEQLGLSRAADRLDAEAAPIEATLQRLQAQDAAAKAQVDGARQIAGRTLEIQSAKIAARETLVHSLAARTIRRFAGRNGLRLEPGDADALAQRVLRGGEEPQTVLSELAARKMGPPPTAAETGGMGQTISDAIAPLNEHAAAAADDLVADVKRVDPAADAPTRAADEAAKSPPPIKTAEALARVQSDTAALEQGMFPEKPQAEAELGAPPIEAPEPTPRPPEIEAAQALVDAAEKRAAARDAVAACPGVIGA